ncbi:MAG: hypothetical protein IPP27_02580 [Bacteroidetes bacterium]|nr:hypothetical protein [Bacteroidota bacterium]
MDQIGCRVNDTKIVSRTSSYTLEVNSSNQLQYRSGAYDANDPARSGQIPIGVWTYVAVVVENTSSTEQLHFISMDKMLVQVPPPINLYHN